MTAAHTFNFLQVRPSAAFSAGLTTHTASRALRPLEVLDLPNVYAQHSALVDLVLYLMLFNGVAQAVLVKRLPGKGGRMVAAAIGTGLALSLSALGIVSDFSLMALGPVAAVVLLGLVGLVIYQTLRRLHLSRAAAGSLVLVLAAMSVEAMAPAMSSTLSATFPILDLLVALGLLTLLWTGFRFFLPKGTSGKMGAVADAVEGKDSERRASDEPGRPPKDQSETEHLKKELKRERPEVGRRLRGIVKRESKESRSILRELGIIKTTLEQGKHPAKDRHRIAEALRRIPPKRHRLHSLIQEVRELDRKLARFDLALLNELRVAYNKIPPGQRPLFKRLALEERKKIKSEQRIQYVEQFIAKYDANAGKSIQLGAERIAANDIPTALKWVNAAIRYEEEARRYIKRSQAIQSMLKRITRLELRQLKRAA